MKKRYLLIIAAVLLAFGLWRIYANNQEAVKQTKAIIAADQAGSDVASATATLNTFVHGHMGAGVSYELRGSYDRAVQKAHDDAQPNVNSELYAQATAACATKNPVAQATCIQNYVSAQPSGTIKTVTLPNESAYKRQVVAPGWSADLAGFSLLAAGTLVAVMFWLWLIDHLSKRF